MLCCASCGIAAVDDVKLKNCACDLVKYCSDDCQKDHCSKHKKICRKRLAELRDRDLFTQPDGTHWGECPICCLPLSLDPKKSTMMSCCSKSICNGCQYANRMREIEAGLEQRCPYCREPAPENDEEVDKRIMKRIKENNDPVAMTHMAKSHRDEGDYETSITYLTEVAELGHAEAHNLLSIMYHYGEGVEKDLKKAIYHMEEGAIGGHPEARHNLGIHEAYNGNFERAKKHWIIAANLGYNGSLKKLMNFYANGCASKEDYAKALRAWQTAVDDTKSAEREKAEEAIKNGDW